ncbi:MAG: kinase [Omnitrophica WOR_2 bacterium RIFCSPLOWO2_12_FULL_50_9]|nr:MAG: kinase [Omnitrophica WOR_2 bacterium RIFCSPHIGHO2_02_FULL_50_17]OGX40859.1 MAG: kinase [Omnitrophica WOR_2 bacterium RIFCSPLOWO2_12_FULL_50_9]
MIISRTPFRVSFFGGGTDYPGWFEGHQGAVLATTINKYCYISCRYLPPFFDHKSRIIYSKMEHVKKVSEIDHPAVREVLKFLRIRQGVEIHHDGDLPARTGLGSSSSFTVGLLNALYALKGVMPTKERLAREAIFVEQEKCLDNVGCQDQTLAAYGGFNLIEFGGKNHLQVRMVTIPEERLRRLQDHLLLYFTGFSRTASEVAKHQIQNIPNKKKELRLMYDMVFRALDILKGGELERFGRLLHESWKIKRELSDKVSTAHIDEIYETAMRAGALGGKLLGAGGGGFILFFVPPSRQKKFKERLKKLLWVPFVFENLGSQIIFYQPNGGHSK